MEGWVKLHRKFIKWEWYGKSQMVHLFIHLLLKANHEDNMWQNILIKKGQFVAGLHVLKAETGISIQSLRTCLERLKSTNEITIKSTNKYSIITICNYVDYQDTEINNNKEINNLPNKQSTNNQQTTNNKQECKEGKEEEKKPNKSAPKEKDFIDQVVECFAKKHGDYTILNPGVERKAAGKILAQYKKQCPNQTSEETLLGLKVFFHQCIHIHDPWLHDKMSLPIIVSQYNSIIKILKNGKTGKQKGATPNEIANAVAKNFADDYTGDSGEYATDQKSLPNVTRRVL